MNEKNLYNNFIEKHSNFARELFSMVEHEKKSFVKTEEHPLYNLGTMERDEDLNISPNIYLANANTFKKELSNISDANLSNSDKKAKVVFDFIGRNRGEYSYEKNADDVLFKTEKEEISRKDFYGSVIYNEIVSNTNYFARHIGDMQIITLPNNGSELPRSTANLPDELKAKVEKSNKNNPDFLPEIFLKRGLYHEAVHAAMGTNDERKCDTFAMLKIIKEHPKDAQFICDMYNFARSKISHTVKELNSCRDNEKNHARKIKIGAMTYIMPNTYNKLKEIALNPSLLDDCKSDADLMRKTYELTSGHEFSDKQLEEFSGILKQNNISKKEMADSEIVKSCIMQSGAKNFDEYLEIDTGLKDFLDKQGAENRINRLKNHIDNRNGKESSLPKKTNKYQKPDISKTNTSELRLNKSKSI